MSNYSDHVYEESFNDSILSFDQYVQESVGLVIAGIAVFIGLLIVLIKKIFFAKNTVEGSADSVYNTFMKIDLLLNSSNLPKRIHVVQGYPIDEKTPAGYLADSIRVYNDGLKALIENPKLGLGTFDLEGMKKEMNSLIEAVKKEFIERTYDTGELRGYVKSTMKQFKDAASGLKELEKLHKSLKNSNVEAKDKEAFNALYKLTVGYFQTEKELTNDWYKNIKRGISESS